MSSGGTICRAASTTRRIRDLPPTSCSTFGRLLFRRVPLPAAMITMANCIVHSPLNALTYAQQHEVNIELSLAARPPTDLRSFAKHIGFPWRPKSYVVCNVDTRESTFYPIFTRTIFPGTRE